MKKLVILAAVAVAAAFTSCSGAKESENVEKQEACLVSKIQNSNNQDSINSYVDQIKAKAQALVSEGKLDEAKQVLDKALPIVKAKAPALAAGFEALISTVENLPVTATDSLKDAGVDVVKSAAGDVKDAAKSAVEGAKSDVKGAVKGAESGVKDAAGSAVKAVGKVLGK